MPSEVLPDTIFKATIEIPAKYEKRYQPIADGSKAKMNVGAIAVLPEGWKLAPKNRLPKTPEEAAQGACVGTLQQDEVEHRRGRARAGGKVRDTDPPHPGPGSQQLERHLL